MGKNILTGWLQVTIKDFKILIKNKFLLLIFVSVILALVMFALFVRFYLGPIIMTFFDFSTFYPSLTTYYILCVIFAVTIFMMSQGAVSITNEVKHGTADRMKIMNMPFFALVFGKFMFYYLSAVIMVILYNIALMIMFLSYSTYVWSWGITNLAVFILLWPLIMVFLAGMFYSLVRSLKGKRE